jgi:hypothetical protein
MWRILSFLHHNIKPIYTIKIILIHQGNITHKHFNVVLQLNGAFMLKQLNMLHVGLKCKMMNTTVN